VFHQSFVKSAIGKSALRKESTDGRDTARRFEKKKKKRGEKVEKGATILLAGRKTVEIISSSSIIGGGKKKMHVSSPRLEKDKKV